ncbi:MAG: TIGR03862 family flavoprotein [Pseudomonadota bacterium]
MTPPTSAPPSRVAIIGGGPAGLMAAERLAAAGAQVHVYDGKPSVGRKFLLAGKGGLNLTHGEPLPAFVARYGEQAEAVGTWLAAFGPQQVRDWAAGLGVETFVGSSGRVFPADMKAAPLLRAWLHRLRVAGVVFHMRHRWVGWADVAEGALPGWVFQTPDGECTVQADAAVLALGGASWPQLGSDGAWVPLLAQRGVDLAPLAPANCGFDVSTPAARQAGRAAGWSPHLAERCAGEPLKGVGLHHVDADGHTWRQLGECVLTQTGLEGSLVYAASARLREAIARDGHADITLDLLPARDAAWVAREVAHPRGSRSLASHLKGRLGLHGARAALLREVLSADEMQDAARLAATIKALPLRLVAPRPVAEAISTAGGVRLDALDDGLMLRALPGVFAAGEMLDWEAPTGGYLLTACLASGVAAAGGVQRWLQAGIPAAGASASSTEQGGAR